MFLSSSKGNHEFQIVYIHSRTKTLPGLLAEMKTLFLSDSKLTIKGGCFVLFLVKPLTKLRKFDVAKFRCSPHRTLLTHPALN